MNKRPLILNFDQSVQDIGQATVLDLGDWQDDIRFGCSLKKFRQLRTHLNDALLDQEYGTVFLGSGDYHHLSVLLIEQVAKRFNEPFQVVVFDNHPDNMRFPFGIHCGSWVSHIAKLPCISHVHVLGITSSDISFAHSWENRLKPLYTGKLSYWCLDVDVAWSHRMGLGKAFRRFEHPDELIATFVAEQKQLQQPTYLSIDKDVLSVDTVQTNWDQGCLSEGHLTDTILALHPHLIGSDITGEVSIWHYQHWWKRFLSSLDQQQTVSSAELEKWQLMQNQLNKRLLNILTD